MTPFIKLGIDFFVFYVVLRFFSGLQTFSLIVTGTLALLLVVFKIPQVHQDRADAVLTPGKPQIIAHRGGAFDAPENTLAAFRNAKKNGADGIELDVEFTKDWVAVVFHDDTVDRTTNGTGHIHSMSFEEVRSLDASAKHSKRESFPDERIPTLEEALVECLKLNMKIYIDVKGYAKQSAKVLSELFKKHPALYTNAAVCSFYPDVIYRVRRSDAGIVTGLIHRPRFLTTMAGVTQSWLLWTNWVGPVCDELRNWSFQAWMWFFCGNSFFLSRNDLISIDYQEVWRARDVQLLAWNVNNDDEKQHLKRNLKVSFITDTLLQEH